MFRVRVVFPELDAGVFLILIEAGNSQLFLAELDATTGEVRFRPLYDPGKKVDLGLPQSDELHWIFMNVLGKRARLWSIPFGSEAISSGTPRRASEMPPETTESSPARNLPGTA